MQKPGNKFEKKSEKESMRLPLHSLFPCLTSLIAGLVVSSPLSATSHDEQSHSGEQTPKWHAKADVLYKAGDSRQIGQLGFTLPLDQTDDALLFLDFRGRVDDQETEEFNLGLAYRKMISRDWIFGAYGFFDRHTSSFGNQFDQGTVGFEFLSEDWDFRVNGYLPDLNSQSVGGAGGGGFGSLTVVGDQFFINTLQFEERAYYGGDYEVGKRLAVFGENDHEVRIFGGGYYFDNDAPGYAHIAGARVRLETRLFDLAFLGEGSRVTLSGEVQWDRVRETQGFGGLAIQIPLGRWEKGSPVGGVSSRHAGLNALERRMLDPILRDIDIVTQSQQSGSTSELALDEEGDAMFLADAGHSVDQAIEKAGENGTVVVSGLVETESARLKEGQRLISATSTQTVVGQESGIRVSGPLPGTQGVIRGTSTLSHVVALTNGVTVDGLHIEGGSVGLFARNLVEDFVIRNNVVSGANNSGLVVVGNFRGQIHDNRFSTSGGGSSTGVNMTRNLGTIENNVFHDNSGIGFLVAGNEGTIRGNQSRSNGEHGFQISQNDGIVENNTATGNAQLGFDFLTNNGSVSGNTANGNVSQGFNFFFNNGSVSGNTANGNDIQGFNIFTNNGSVVSNTANGNVLQGFNIFTNNDLIAGNSASENDLQGFVVVTNAAGGVFRDNVSLSNGLQGYSIPFNSGTLLNNTGSGNGLGGNTAP